jgi:hypothetical protein
VVERSQSTFDGGAMSNDDQRNSVNKGFPKTYDTPTFVAIKKFWLPHKRVTENSTVTPTTGTKTFWSMQIFGHHMVCDRKFSVTTSFDN